MKALADVGDVKEPGCGVEGVAPRISEAFCPDLTTVICLPYERVARWNRVRIAVIDIEPQQGSEQRVEILSVAQWISAAAAVPEPGVQHPVRSEREQAAVVIAVRRVWCGDDQLRRRGIGDFRIGAGGKSLDPDVAIRLRGEVDVEKMIRGVVGMKGDAQQSTLAAAEHSAGDVEERRRL